MDATIVGGSGYTGGELLRILVRHPKAGNITVTSTQHAGKKVSSIHTNLRGVYDKEFKVMSEKTLDADVVFLATPHGESMNIAPKLVEKGVKVVDLSADYRFKDVKVYEQFYGKHASPGLCRQAVYGLPEINRSKIKKTQLVANPGCYPTSVILGVLPLKGMNLKIEKVTVDSFSGTSGAGSKPTEFTHHSEVDENLKVYNVGKHRHRPEMEAVLSEQLNKKVKVSFTPTLIPVIRGIQSNIHISGKSSIDMMKRYKKIYKKEPFVRITEMPYIKNVANTNFCDIGVWQDQNAGEVTVVSVIDNLVKGAAGQAVQNMNIMQRFEETEGLKNIAGHP
ncbi:MAG: N-acetyl-gamma-glutamyl-phosphate reductase [Candidatus Altiarchaeales archaeon]|nr:N-acetyl-gamma-glutamyl-phosphate reductase [Candidatus Altiarchaeales archaeon]